MYYTGTKKEIQPLQYVLVLCILCWTVTIMNLNPNPLPVDGGDGYHLPRKCWKTLLMNSGSVNINL